MAGNRPGQAAGDYQTAWRVDFAGRVSIPYASRSGVAFVLLGGSPSRGLSDEYSDLDIVVYWEGPPDAGWLESCPLLGYSGERVSLNIWKDEDCALESYRFGSLKVDFGHISLSAWEKMVQGILTLDDTSPESLGSVAGFLDAIPLSGGGEYESRRSRIPPYPDDLARAVIERNIRFFVEGYLENQALGRGEILATVDGVSTTLRKMLGILAALNRVWFNQDEPRWLEFWLGRMPLRPDRFLDRMNEILASPGRGHLEALEALVGEVLDLVRSAGPGIDVDSRRTRRRSLAVTGCPAPPPLCDPDRRRNRDGA